MSHENEHDHKHDHCGCNHDHEHHCECGHGHKHEHHAHEGHESHSNKYLDTLAKHATDLDDAEISAKARQIIEENNAEDYNPEVLRYLVSTIEMTTLRETDNDESVLRLTENVNRFFGEHPELPSFATICVYPCFAGIVSHSLEIDGTKVACVTGSFPSSQTFIEVKTAETALAAHDGAEELDMVLPVGKYLSGDYEGLCDEISEIKAACAGAPLKVILETGALQKATDIKKAALLSMYAGADFIKTSTGKISVSATPEAAYVMATAIREFYEQTKIRVGLKISGGVNSVADAVGYYSIAKMVLGKEWFDAGLFRVGTSRLANLLLSEVLGEELRVF